MTGSFMARRGTKVLTFIVLAVVLVYFLFPLYWLLLAATKSNAAMTTSNGLWFADEIRLKENYETLLAWTRGHFWRWVGNSLLYSTVAGAAGTLISVSAGYAIAKFRFPGRSVSVGVISAGLLLPIALLTIPMFIVFHSLGLTDTIWAIILPSCVSPFGVFLGMIYADSSVPTELMEAARIDGASEPRIFFTMGAASAGARDGHDLPVHLRGDLEQLPAAADDAPQRCAQAHHPRPVRDDELLRSPYGAVMQGALLGVLPLIVLFLGLQRFWQAGLAAGAVKG